MNTEENQKQEPDFLKSIWELSKPYVPSLLGIFLLALVTSGISLIIPWIYREIVDLITQAQGLTDELFRTFLWLVAGYFGLRILSNIVTQSKNHWMRRINYLAELEITQKVLDKFTEFDVNLYDSVPTGGVADRVHNGVIELSSMMRSLTNSLLPPLFSVTATVVIVGFFNVYLALIFLLAIPFYLIVNHYRNRKLNELRDTLHKLWEEKYQALYNLFKEMRLFRYFTAESFMVGKVRDALIGIQESGNSRDWFRRWTSFSRDFLGRILPVSAIVGYSGYLALTGDFSAGDFVLMFTYAGRLFGPLSELSGYYDQYQESLRRVKRMILVYEMSGDETEVGGNKGLDIVQGKIEFGGVSFIYPEVRYLPEPETSREDIFSHREKRTSERPRKQVLNDISFIVEPNQKVALVGPSGVGKSTIFDLILKFYFATEGQVLFDDMNVKAIKTQDLRSKISVVSQETLMVNDTIAENLRIANVEASDEELWEALRLSGLKEMVEEIPEKLETRVGEKGIKLSGGERQRLSMARAILKDAPVLLLDEATSSIDTEKEKEIQGNLEEFWRDKTVMVIAHRLSTVKKMDKILVLKDGEISERGTHENLMNRDDYYAKMFRMQSTELIE